MKFCDQNRLKNQISHTPSKYGIINCSLRRKASVSGNIRTHQQNRVKLMKERPVAEAIKSS